MRSVPCQHQQRDQPRPGTRRTATQRLSDIPGVPPRRLWQPTAVSRASGEPGPKRRYETRQALRTLQTAPRLQVPPELRPGMAALLGFLKWLRQLSTYLPAGKLGVMCKAGTDDR